VYVIATAGHVDHGKSTLVRALTGIEPDRWAEEQRRGMTIDLGYAWTTLPGGATVAFVDVPGHQRFISNMLAGVGPVPAVLFVVAADAGWSAQSREHLEALDALQVRHGVLALTRSDLGDAELAESEARDYLAGTTLAEIEAVAVNGVTGAGLTQLRDALDRMVARLPDPAETRTRLWIDRVFTVRGAGTVVTGTLTSGTVRVGDEMHLHPSGDHVSVRGIELLKQPVGEVTGVARVALNLRGLKPAQVRRGDALTLPDQWADVSVMDVRLSSADRLPQTLILHLGSAGVPVHFRPLGPDTARLTLARPLTTSVGERGVLRDPGARRIAAVTVLDTFPPGLRGRGAARRRALQLEEVTGEPDLAGEIVRRGAVRTRDLVLAGITQPPVTVPEGAVSAAGWLVDSASWNRWRDLLPAMADDWAAVHPLQPGIPRAKAAAELNLPDAAILDRLVAELPELVVDSTGLHRRGRHAVLPPEAEAELDRLLARLAADPFDAPLVPELAAAGLTREHLAVAVRDGRLVRVGDAIYLTPQALDEAVGRLAALDQPFSMAAAREALGTSRRVSVPLLEHLDRAGRTRRVDTQLRQVRTP
jgi:selenocysteine-specific elongation factor